MQFNFADKLKTKQIFTKALTKNAVKKWKKAKRHKPTENFNPIIKQKK